MSVRAVAVAALLSAAGCASKGAFVCDVDQQCVRNGTQGTCELVGFCSFPDADCLSGRRFGALAPDGVADECVRTPGEMDAGLGAFDAPPGTPDAPPSPDAPPGAPDAMPPPPDAAPPGTPDAAPPPDAPPPADAGPDAAMPTEVTATFGETGATTYAGVTIDTWLNSDEASKNYGGSVQLRSDGDPDRFAILRFDLSAIPPGATVTAAQLTIWTASGGGLTMGTMRVLALLEDWTEGAADGGGGTANWNNRMAGVPWTTPGAGAPGSRGATVLAEWTPSVGDMAYLVALPTSTVQGWVASPATNHGIVFEPHDAGDRSALFVSSEGTAARRPVLQVTWTVP